MALQQMMEPLRQVCLDYSLIGSETGYSGPELTSYWSMHPETRQIIVDAPITV